MKQLFFMVCLAVCNHLYAQNSSVQMRGDFADLAKLGRNQGAESLPTYSSNNVKGTRYFLENWSAGTVTTTKDEVYSNIYLFMFDKQHQDLYIKQKDSALILLADKSQIKKFTLLNTLTFVQGAQINGAEPGKFYQLMVGKEDGYSFFKLTTTKFIKANRQDAERIKNGDFNDEFRDDITYFIKSPGQPLQKIRLSENSIVRTVPTEARKIKAFYDAHFSDESDEHLVSQLVDELNSK